MTDIDRNMRTLIICFVLAVGVLTPLRFLESNQTMNQEVKVLGETAEEIVEDEVNFDEEVSEVIETNDGEEQMAEFDPTLEVEEIILPEVGGF